MFNASYQSLSLNASCKGDTYIPETADLFPQNNLALRAHHKCKLVPAKKRVRRNGLQDGVVIQTNPVGRALGETRVPNSEKWRSQKSRPKCSQYTLTKRRKLTNTWWNDRPFQVVLLQSFNGCEHGCVCQHLPVIRDPLGWAPCPCNSTTGIRRPAGVFCDVLWMFL